MEVVKLAYIKSTKYILWFIVASVIGSILGIVMQFYQNPIWLENAIDAYYEGSEAYVKQIIQIAPISLFITDLLIILPIVGHSVWKKKYIGQKITVFQCSKIILLGLILNLIISACCDFIPFPKSWSSSLETYTNAAVTMSPIITIICTGILAPIMEELIFRYGILGSLKGKGPILAIGVSSVLFGVMHMNIIQGGYAFLMGIVLGYLYWKTNNINVSILLHISVNLSSVLTTFLPMHELLSLSIFIIITLLAKKIIENKTKKNDMPDYTKMITFVN